MKYGENHEAWRYHAKYEPKIFIGEAIAIADEAGWVDSPAKIDYTEEEGAPDAPENETVSEEVADCEADAEPEAETEVMEIEVPEDLSELTVKQLRKLCKKMKLTGYSSMREADLVALIEANK